MTDLRISMRYVVLCTFNEKEGCHYIHCTFFLRLKVTPEKDYGMWSRNICLCISKCRPILLYVETQLLNNIAQPDRIALSQNVTLNQDKILKWRIVGYTQHILQSSYIIYNVQYYTCTCRYFLVLGFSHQAKLLFGAHQFRAYDNLRNETTKQWNNETAKQQNNGTTKQRSNET